VDHRAEPPSWLPEGVTPHVISSSGQGGQVAAETKPEAESPPATAESSPGYGQEGSYEQGSDGLYTYGQPSSFGEETVFDSSYNPSGRAGSEAPAPPPHAPPYTAGFPPQPSATSTADLAGVAGDPAATARTSAFRRSSPAKSKAATVQPRRANLVVARLEPWSVMKFSFLMSLVAWLALFVAVALLYYALSGLGVFAALQRTLTSVTSSQGSSGVDLSKWTSASRILGYTMLIGAVNVVLITALSTIGAMIYNLVTHLGGGIEVTLKETD
jgi:Transmembrane domain of unknown function (DUF3566)